MVEGSAHAVNVIAPREQHFAQAFVEVVQSAPTVGAEEEPISGKCYAGSEAKFGASGGPISFCNCDAQFWPARAFAT